MMLGRDHVLLKSNVALPEFDYVALGHIHRHQVIGREPHVAYSGSLERIDFGEEDDDKGFCVVDLDPAKPAGSRMRDFAFERVDARGFLTVPVTIRAGDIDPTATVVKAIMRHNVRDAIVRVRIDVPADLEALLRDGDIRRALEGAHFVSAISREVLDRPRTRLGSAYSRGLDPGEALKLYLETRNVPEDRAEILLRHAERLMEDGGPG